MNNVAQLNGWAQFSCVQMEHSLCYRTEELELFSYCHCKGIGITAYSPLMDGHLARPIGIETTRTKRVDGTFFEKKRRESDIKIINRVVEIAEKRGWKMSQVALAWSVTKITSPVVGANTPEKLLETIITGKRLTDEEIKFLEEPYEHQPVRF
ncbi:Aldo/keto reductase [Tricholoma matsutake]|nr:Aldo/keto reductase [Tricholoma matsutake 945]